MSAIDPPKRSFKLRHPDPTASIAFSSLLKYVTPLWVKVFLIGLLLLGWLPLAMAIRARVNLAKPDPKIHPIQDMDNMPKYKEQMASPIFVDGRADRPQVPGTIARGTLSFDDHFSLGYTRVKNTPGTSAIAGASPDVFFFNEFPPSVKVDEAFIRRGQQVFNITCANCHGRDGMGNGPVNARAISGGSMATGWVKPTDLLGDSVRARPNGHIYNTINNGIRNMAPHGPQIEPNDRWAVVAYVRALQLSRAMPAGELSEEDRQKLN